MKTLSKLLLYLFHFLFIYLIEIMEPPLNIQCYFAEAIYVKVPVNMRITVKNPSDRVLYIVANLSNSDIFMFSGHRHISLALYPNSQQDLLFNLLPLKAGWQFLPELNLDFNTQLIESNGGRLDDHIQIKLNDLVKRWMPKQVFVLVSRFTLLLLRLEAFDTN